jgi:hypothetical protein
MTSSSFNEYQRVVAMAEYELLIKARVRSIAESDDIDLNDEDMEHLLDAVSDAIDGTDIELQMDPDGEEDSTDWVLDVMDVQESRSS